MNRVISKRVLTFKPAAVRSVRAISYVQFQFFNLHSFLFSGPRGCAYTYEIFAGCEDGGRHLAVDQPTVFHDWSVQQDVVDPHLDVCLHTRCRGHVDQPVGADAADFIEVEAIHCCLSRSALHIDARSPGRRC